MSMNFRLVKGDDKALIITAMDEDDAPVDLTGISSLEWGLYPTGIDAANDTNAVITKTLVSGITVTDAEDGVFKVTMSATETAGLTVGKAYFHNAVIVDADGNRASLRNTDGYIGTAKVLL